MARQRYILCAVRIEFDPESAIQVRHPLLSAVPSSSKLVQHRLTLRETRRLLLLGHTVTGLSDRIPRFQPKLIHLLFPAYPTPSLTSAH